MAHSGPGQNVGKAAAAAPFAEYDVIGYLLDHAKELSRSQGKIAQAILDHPKTFVEKPIDDLVPWLGCRRRRSRGLAG